MSHIRFGKEKVERKEHRQRHEKDPLIGRTGVLKPHLSGNHYIYIYICQTSGVCGSMQGMYKLLVSVSSYML